MHRNSPELILRVDANATTGTGHLMRCLALAQAWQSRGCRATFLSACDSPPLMDRILEDSMEWVAVPRLHPDPVDLETTLGRIVSDHPSWIVLDGYHFDSAYQQRIKETGHSLMAIDDLVHFDHYYADVVLNQNINAPKLSYPCEPYTRLLLGAPYALLRREFLAWRGWQRPIVKMARRVLVSLGGSDIHNQTLTAVRALRRTHLLGLEVVVAIGGGNPHLMTLLKEVESSEPPAIQLRLNVGDMASLMAWADVAISAGGITCLELAFMGLPSLMLVTADNQRDVAEEMDKARISRNLGWWEDVDEDMIAREIQELLGNQPKRYNMSRQGQKLVDGLGAERVLNVLASKERSYA